MQEISVLPGRIRWRNPSLTYNKALARYINVYVDNLYGVKYSVVNHITASILVFYDPFKTDYRIIGRNIENAISSALQNKPEPIRAYDEYAQALEKRDQAKRNFFIYGTIYLALKVKDSIYGKFPFSKNIRILQAASLVTIIGGYPLLKSLYQKFSKHIPTDSDLLLSLTALSFTLARESAKGVSLLMLKALNDYLKYAADAESFRLFNQSRSRTSGMAWLVFPSGQENLVHLETLKREDVIAVHEGEVITVQGEVIEGSAYVNALYYSGQPIISRIAKGSMVDAGMSLLSGNLRIKIKSLPEKTEKGFLKKEDMRIHQRVSQYRKTITPIALGAGAASFLLSGNIMNALAVLLVLTPSGAGTALSTGMKSYITLLNKHKIYLRRPEVFEKIIDTNHIFFDKTGTLTYGRMELVSVTSFDPNFSDAELIQICAACESDHYHPISLTLQDEAQKKSREIPRAKNAILIPSKGVRATYEQHTVLIGNKEFMHENGIDLGDRQEMVQSWEKRLLTPVLVSIDHELTGIMALADVVREGAGDLIERIKQKGSVDLTLLSGDHAYKSKYIAQKLGIGDVYSNCSDQDKAKVIEEYKTWETVMMVGDGINDVMAMREADTSVSFVNFSCDQVKLNSDVIIFEDHMLRLADMIALSQRAYRKMNQCISLSQLYNIFLGGLAFVGAIDAFQAKSFNTINSLMALLFNKQIEYLSPDRLRSPSEFKGCCEIMKQNTKNPF
ncbi:heavy metal translocating P-type ATPase [Candidatus Formimonas warabiya]|uniref:P-type Cu(+) transporter n=1 Tax=Formimonas warabiya TaxID=1761012 RepID=A0A3G1KVK7_FORW1|nr:HAD-IC family P-type ATPase [Candidatus Formimonas warabiya]ATW26255.1 hypothetical protein DCMF_17155 [Candidatus Formimonas warabiya]